MKVISIGYDSKIGWKYSKIDLNNINLIVGFNACGKTRTVSSIKKLWTNILNGKLIKYNSRCGGYDIMIKDESTEEIYHYTLEYILDDGLSKIVSETLFKDGKRLLQRNENGLGEIFSTEEKCYINFEIDEDILAISAKRDKIHHNYLEGIFNWAKKGFFFSFGSNLDKQNMLYSEENANKLSDESLNLIMKLKNASDKFGEEVLFKKIITQMNQIGYGITNIYLDEFRPRIWTIDIEEKDLKYLTPIYEMSQGMYRAFCVICCLNICILEKETEMIMIDDIGEGLDYERATSLIKIIIKEAEEANLQIIMTTNDRYIINEVPLKYWQIAQREKGDINFYNYNNSKEQFDDFEFTGLSNFDFLDINYNLGKDI